jgi:hypothetical protein
MYSSPGKWVFPPFLWSFPPTATFTTFLLLITGHVLPLLPSPAGLWGISPPHLLGTQGTPPSLLQVFFVVIAYYSGFFSFFPGWGLVCPGAMLIWPRIVCGSTAYRLAHLVVCVFPSHLSSCLWKYYALTFEIIVIELHFETISDLHAAVRKSSDLRYSLHSLPMQHLPFKVSFSLYAIISSFL